MKMINILVTGGQGYIGNKIVEKLEWWNSNIHLIDNEQQYFNIYVIDPLIFGNNTYTCGDHTTIIKNDIRFVHHSIFKDKEIVIDLQSLCNDPSGEMFPYETYDINYLGRIRTQILSKLYDARLYLFQGSCSVYGSNNKLVSENDSINPLTTYQKCSQEQEKSITNMQDDKFKVISFRQQTIFGYSKRMRLDLSVNKMQWDAITTNNITINGTGQQSRPFLHVEDLQEIYLQQILDYITGKNAFFSNQNKNTYYNIINAGNSNQNYSILELQYLISSKIKQKILFNQINQDFRNYKVDFTKLNQIFNTINFKFTKNRDISYQIDEITTNSEFITKILPTTISINQYKNWFDI